MAITLPPLLTDKLTAVNVLLASIAEAPVNALEPSQSVDAQIAQTTLDEVTNSVLSYGYHFNREDGLVLAPALDKTIPLPINCLYIGAAYGEGENGISERSRKLYDRDNHTFEFTKSVTVDLILRLEWEEMPEYVRRYITIRSAQLFQGRVQNDRVVQSVQDSEVSDALAILSAREDENRPQNSIRGNVDTRAKLWGRGGLRRR